MSSTDNGYADRRTSDTAWRERLEKRLDEIAERIDLIEGRSSDAAARRRHVREFFDDLARWVVYGGKIVGSLIVIGGATVAVIAWIAKNGG